MKRPNLLSINRSQDEYLNLLLYYEELVRSDELSIFTICSFLDEVNCFWLKRLKIIALEIEELTESNDCFVLFGDLSLDISNYEHYYFKALGDYHFIPDPFLKLEVFFRQHEEKINVKKTTKQFKKTFFRTLEILNSYKDCFYVLPVHEISVEDAEYHSELIENFFWNFISNAFDSDIRNREEFLKRFTTFEDIESNLISNLNQDLIFNNFDDFNLSLKDRVDLFVMEFNNVSTSIFFKSDADKFYLSVYSLISQLADMFYVCSVLRTNTYVFNDVTFSYLTLLMSNFIEEENLKKMIEKTLICYMFYRTIDKKIYIKMDFNVYIEKLKKAPLLNLILEKSNAQKINLFFDKPTKIIEIIKQEFTAIL